MARIKNRRRFIGSILIVMILSTLFILFAVNHYLGSTKNALIPGDTETILVTIPRGTSTGEIAELLKQQGLIADTTLFRIKSKLEGYEGNYKAGEYPLSAGMTMEEMMSILLAGHDNVTRFTIPEGYDIGRTIETLSSQGLIDSEAFQKEVEMGDFDYSFMSLLPAGKNRLEGFLYPETYEVYSDANEHEIIDKMLSQFDQVFDQKRIERAKEIGMDPYAVVILASIIEREAVISEDRPVIAGVFYNRLRIEMPLQSCATVQYILGEQKAVLSDADVKIESPYNTYRIAGLPPTPICSPGIESIDAALWPTSSDYLYFLAKGDGSHVFSTTYEEHLRNKARYID